jgi:hypothetical protein
MRITELIGVLKRALHVHGDLSVVGTSEGQVNDVDSAFMSVHGKELYVDVENLRTTPEGSLAGLPEGLDGRQVRGRR